MAPDWRLPVHVSRQYDICLGRQYLGGRYMRAIVTGASPGIGGSTIRKLAQIANQKNEKLQIAEIGRAHV